MKLNQQPYTLYVYDDFPNLRGDRRPYRVLLAADENCRLVAHFNVDNLRELLRLVQFFKLPVQLGMFTDDADGILMRGQLIRALQEQ